MELDAFLDEKRKSNIFLEYDLTTLGVLVKLGRYYVLLLYYI
jgi:hypothetical protein